MLLNYFLVICASRESVSCCNRHPWQEVHALFHLALLSFLGWQVSHFKNTLVVLRLCCSPCLVITKRTTIISILSVPRKLCPIKACAPAWAQLRAVQLLVVRRPLGHWKRKGHNGTLAVRWGSLLCFILQPWQWSQPALDWTLQRREPKVPSTKESECPPVWVQLYEGSQCFRLMGLARPSSGLSLDVNWVGL